jgi:hypothetical protein
MGSSSSPRFPPVLPGVLWVLLAAGCASGGIDGSDPFARSGDGVAAARAYAPAGDSVLLTGSVSVAGDESGAIHQALVTLVTPGGSERAAARSDTLGTFDLGVVAAGNYVARARAEGFDEVEVAVEVRGLPPVRLVVHLAPIGAPETASTIEVQARRDFLQTVGFHDRRARESGSFLAGEEIGRRSAPYPSELLVSMPGFRMAPFGGRVTVVGRRGCPPKLFVDGMDVGDTRQVDLIVTMETIAAVEAYPGSTPPAEFAGFGSGCGAVVIWTRRGG